MLGPATARSDVLRWGAALLVIAALHGALVLALLDRVVVVAPLPAAVEAVMLELAPILEDATAAPPDPAIPPPPPTPPSMAEAVAPALPVRVEIPPTPPVAAEVSLPPRPRVPPRIVSRPKPPAAPRLVVQRSAAPAPAEPAAVTAPVASPAAQPAPRPPASASSALPGWRSALLARLQAAKRYPDLARSRGDQGVATVTFTMDRSGRVLSVALVRSAGSSLLDEEAEALVRRAGPLPPLPDDVAGASLTLTVPISFALR